MYALMVKQLETLGSTNMSVNITIHFGGRLRMISRKEIRIHSILC